MTDFNDFRRRYAPGTFGRAGSDARTLFERSRAYLRRRPAESWLFFFAGIVVGAILG